MMERIRIPGTELDASRFSYGTTSFGIRLKGEQADRLVGRYFEAGGNFMDTAHCYSFWEKDGLGKSERELGACLRRLGVRKEAIVATKGGHPDGGPDYPRPDMFLSPEVIESDITESLERLGMDVIDLYYLHRDDTRVPVDEIMETLNAEVQKGRIRYLGASNWSVQRIASANAYAKGRGLEPFRCSQVQWSLAEPTWTIDQDPTLRYITQVEATWHQTTGLPVVSYTSTAGGYFAGRGQDEGDFATEENAQRLARAEKLARKKNCTPTQIALAYLINHDFPVYPCFGTTNPDHLEEILGAEPIELDDGEIRYLREG